MNNLNDIQKKKIQKLFDEVETYKQAIRDAEDALASADQELDEVLDTSFLQPRH